jgi:hypothetical protein
MGEPPKETKFAQLNAQPVLPPGIIQEYFLIRLAFPEWQDRMNHWGNKMGQAVSVAAQMLAVGLGLPKDLFTNLAKNGPHLLAPTGSDLDKYGKLNTVLAGFHA